MPDKPEELFVDDAPYTPRPNPSPGLIPGYKKPVTNQPPDTNGFGSNPKCDNPNGPCYCGATHSQPSDEPEQQLEGDALTKCQCGPDLQEERCPRHGMVEFLTLDGLKAASLDYAAGAWQHIDRYIRSLQDRVTELELSLSGHGVYSSGFNAGRDYEREQQQVTIAERDATIKRLRMALGSLGHHSNECMDDPGPVCVCTLATILEETKP